MSIMEQDENGLYIWEYHSEFESYKWYERFREFYLKQDTPRRLIEAYRRYRVAETDTSPNEASKIDFVAGGFKKIFQGYKSQQAKKKTWVSWQVRASAYDSWLQRNIDMMIMERRMSSSVTTIERVNRLMDKWDEFFNVASVLKQTSTRRVPYKSTDPETGEEVTLYREIETHKLDVGQFRSLITAFDDIRSLERRELGLAERINQNNIADNDGGKLDVTQPLMDVFAASLQTLQNQLKEAGNVRDLPLLEIPASKVTKLPVEGESND